MTIRIPRFLAVLVLCMAVLVPVFSQEVSDSLATGLREYQAANFTVALEAFREAAGQANGGDYQPYADFWVARSLMATGNFSEASDAFDLFLVTFRDHPYREESAYQRARLFYLTEQYEAAVQGFNVFQVSYPESDFTANALYWTGESLFALGRLTEARRFFAEVTEQHPTSYRVEAARYRQDIIDLEQRENELLTLLQWSHEEYLAALDEFRQKEIAYQEALQSYRERLSTLAVEDFREEIQLLNARIGELEDTLAERDDRINDLLGSLRQAEADANAAMNLVQAMQAAAMAAPAAVPVQTDMNQQTQPAPVESTETVPPTSSAPADSSPSAVQNELLSLKASALELQQRLLQEEGE